MCEFEEFDVCLGGFKGLQKCEFLGDISNRLFDFPGLTIAKQFTYSAN